MSVVPCSTQQATESVTVFVEIETADTVGPPLPRLNAVLGGVDVLSRF